LYTKPLEDNIYKQLDCGGYRLRGIGEGGTKIMGRVKGVG
jgi:hypothetical protein